MITWWTILLVTFLTLIVKEDLKFRKARNSYIFFVFTLSAFSLICSGDIAREITLTIMIFLAFFVLWMINVIGAGDVKLITALALGIKSEFIPLYLIFIGLLGGIQALHIYLHSESMKNHGLPFTLPVSISGFIFFFLTQLTY